MMKNIISHMFTFLARFSWCKILGVLIFATIIIGSNISTAQSSSDDCQKYNAATGQYETDFACVNASKPPPETCPLIEELKAKYQPNPSNPSDDKCWACPIIESLVDAFIGAATTALSLSKEAGIFVLKFGAILWVLLWGLRHVSSLAQVEPANILSELIKFLFKVMLAYAFILGGITAIGTYLINPIMGFGAKIAENFWEEEYVKGNTKEYVWENITEEDYKEAQGHIDQGQQNYGGSAGSNGSTGGTDGSQAGSQSSADGSNTSSSSEDTSVAEEAAMAAAKDAQKDFYKYKVPDFIVPPVYAGNLTSPAGCRKNPTTNEWKNHHGLDIAQNNGAYIVASGPGVISWHKNGGTGASGYGYYAIITHKNGWSSLYAHMNPSAYEMVPSGSTVVKGQVIGIVGNSGASTGPHLHFEIKYNGRPVDPLRLLAGELVYIDGACPLPTGESQFPQGFSSNMAVPKSASAAWTVHNNPVVDLTPYAPSNNNQSASNGTSGTSGGNKNYGSYTPSYGGFTYKYKGSSVILSKSIVDSMIGATKAIQSITSENMILGEAVMCYATQQNGGAITFKGGKIMSNPIKWLEGAFIWVTGLLLTLAYVFYLLDIAFKIGFAVIALPIAAGLWPFEMTKDKFGVCISIITKAAAMFAFIALTTTYTVSITNAVFSYEEDISDEGPEEYQVERKGLSRLYDSFDKITQGKQKDTDIEYASDKLSLFSTTFIMLLFAFLYSFNLVRQTVPDLVNKFFPDKAFGDSSPMHQWSTAVAKGIKDVAMKPVGYARDIAMHQSGRLAQKGAGAATQAVGTVASKGVQYAGKGVQAVGKGVQAAGKGLHAVPVVGNIAGGLVSAAGKATEIAGKAVETTGKVAEKATKTIGDVAEKASDATQKATDGKSQDQEKDKKGDKQ